MSYDTQGNAFKPGQTFNVININNYNTNIFNVISTADGKSHGKSELKTKFDAETQLKLSKNASGSTASRSSSESFPEINEFKQKQTVEGENCNIFNPQYLIRLEAPTQKSVDFLTHQKYQDPELTIMSGYLTIFLTFVGFVILSFWMIGSKFLPETGHAVIDFMRTDYHYCVVLPLLYPVFYIFIYKNWASMKAFRHN